jgi:type IV fimbrial biogenesis protein FimT
MSTPRPYGFTIIELMLTVAVLATLLAIGAPSFVTLIANNRLTTQANLFIGDLNLARIEAVRRNQTAIITATDPEDDNEFGGGWTIWIDEDSDDIMDAEERIRIADPLSPSTTLDSAGDITEIEFARNGALAAGGAQDFELCDDRTGETGRAISITPVGRVEIDNEFECP